MKITVQSPRSPDAGTVGKGLRTPVVIAVVEVGREPACLALAAQGSVACVCNTEDSTLTLIDTTAHRVSAVISLPIRPLAVVIDPKGSRAYAAGLGKPLVVVIDIPARKVIGTITASEGQAMAISAGGERIFINANSPTNGQIGVIDTASARLLDTIDAGPFTSAAVLSEDGRLFHCDYLHHELKVMDTLTAEVSTVLSLPEPFEEMALSPEGDFGYAPYRTTAGIVVKIELSSYDVVDWLPVPALPHGFTLSPDGGLACCCSAAERSVSIIDTGTWQVVSRFQAGEYPQAPVFSADGKRLYICDSSGDAVWVVALD
ncbi:DNA-binding beta-propeller fold protein YncE [Pseudomonas frederiksbergensis]|uniref:YncE family protein n=1 Tax=Pseudomonas frederiksbergensis TaxID=104087 RepID=UPI003D1A0515